MCKYLKYLFSKPEENVSVHVRKWNPAGYFEKAETISAKDTPSLSTAGRTTPVKNGVDLLNLINGKTTASTTSTNNTTTNNNTIKKTKEVDHSEKIVTTKADPIKNLLFQLQNNNNCTAEKITSNSKEVASPNIEKKKDNSSKKKDKTPPKKMSYSEVTEGKKKSKDKSPKKDSNELFALSASSSFAWSSFQNSPDPKALPMPSFVRKARGESEVSITSLSSEDESLVRLIMTYKYIYFETN